MMREFFLPRRGSVLKPRVGAYSRLPWVHDTQCTIAPTGRTKCNALLFACLLASASLFCASAETPRPAKPPALPLGPLVDVTLRNGFSRQGQLLSYVDGTL